MKCPNCDYANTEGASHCAWCKKELPRTVRASLAEAGVKERPLEKDAQGAEPPQAPAPAGTGAPRPYANAYALIGTSFALIWNYIFLAPHFRYRNKDFITALSITSLLCALIGFYFARKIALTMSYGKSVKYGAIAGALVGAVNGTAVFPALGTGIGAVIGLVLGALCGPLMVLLCSGFGARR